MKNIKTSAIEDYILNKLDKQKRLTPSYCRPAKREVSKQRVFRKGSNGIIVAIYI